MYPDMLVTSVFKPLINPDTCSLVGGLFFVSVCPPGLVGPAGALVLNTAEETISKRKKAHPRPKKSLHVPRCEREEAVVWFETLDEGKSMIRILLDES